MVNFSILEFKEDKKHRKNLKNQKAKFMEILNFEFK